MCCPLKKKKKNSRLHIPGCNKLHVSFYPVSLGNVQAFIALILCALCLDSAVMYIYMKISSTFSLMRTAIFFTLQLNKYVIM